jgi:hypothetical protein
MVDISDVDKPKLLAALWLNQKTASFFDNMPGLAPGYNEAEAGAAIARGPIDYFCGRAIKADLSAKTVDPADYDYDAGKGAFQKVVSQVRQGSARLPKKAAELKCPGGSQKNFAPYGDAMLEGNPGTVMCAHCGYWKKQHQPEY